MTIEQLNFLEKIITLYSKGEDKEQLIKELNELQYFKDSNTGLWVTDRPDLVEDPLNIMYQI
jgi:hypothetical protein